jgi:hypothetical protein
MFSSNRASVLVVVLVVVASLVVVACNGQLRAEHKHESAVSIGPTFKQYPGFDEMGSKDKCTTKQHALHQAYIKWLNDGGADTSMVNIEPRCSERGWMYFRVTTKNDTPNNVPLFSIPEPMVMDSEKAVDWLIQTTGAERTQLPGGFLALSLYLTNELAKPTSPYRAWLDTMDQSMDGSPLHWLDDDDVVETLDESRLAAFASALHDQLKREYKSITEGFIEQMPEHFPAKQWTFERFAFARCYVFAFARDQTIQLSEKEDDTRWQVSLVPLWDHVPTNYSSTIRLPMLRDGGFDLISTDEEIEILPAGTTISRQPLRLDFSDFDVVLLTGKLPAITHGSLQIASTRLNTNHLEPIADGIQRLLANESTRFEPERLNIRMGSFDYNTATVFRNALDPDTDPAKQRDIALEKFIEVLSNWEDEYLSTLEQDKDMLLKHLERSDDLFNKNMVDALRIRMTDKMLIRDNIVRAKQLLKHEIILKATGPDGQPLPPRDPEIVKKVMEDPNKRRVHAHAVVDETEQEEQQQQQEQEQQRDEL